MKIILLHNITRILRIVFQLKNLQYNSVIAVKIMLQVDANVISIEKSK